MNNYGVTKGRRRRWPKILIVLAAVALMVTITSVLIIRRTYEQNLRPVSNSQEVKDVNIPSGSSVKDIAKMLEDHKLIRASWAFEWYVRNSGASDELLAGTYPIRPNQSVQDIVSILTHGKVSADLVTILPGQRLDEIRTTLVNYGFNQAEVDRALDPKLYMNHPALVDKPANASLEGYIYPESFQKIAATKPETLINAALDELQKVLTPKLRAEIVRQGLTVHEGIILASVIEQEAGHVDDKPIIAQVFLKRLSEDRPLESDVTVLYGAIAAGEKPSLSYDSPYNTFKHKGLPIGPISNVSKSSLEAVANPAATDYLFFVAADPKPDGSPGKTYFSRTLEEHERFTAEHCKTLCNTQ